MPRLIPAAKQLLRQVKEVSPKATTEVLDDVDGYGFQRSVRIKGDGSKRVVDALEAMRDPRIAEIVRSNQGTRVTFVNTTRADFAHPFPFAEVLAVLED